MRNEFVNVDLVRLSQSALPTGKTYDLDKNGTLDEKEYKGFISDWNKNHQNQSPLLMQLHIKTLNDNAKKLAELCDNIDTYKGVLTEGEIQQFMDLCEKHGIKSPFKQGTSVEGVLTGDTSKILSSAEKFEDKSANTWNNSFVKTTLFENWFKLDVIGYKGSDKYFHAVGNYEAMDEGAEATVKKVCEGQHQDKLKNTTRAAADYTEDLYANWLGREFYKMYPDKSPHDLFAPLAPKGFSIEKSKKSPIELFYNEGKDKDGWFGKKIKEYYNYFEEKYIRNRFLKEIKEIF